MSESTGKAGAVPASLARASASVSRRSQLIPYMIAGAFIGLTALLTLLLTLIIDNQSELDRIMADRQQSASGPILADARRIFGQEPEPAEPLLDTSLAVSPPDGLDAEKALPPDSTTMTVRSAIAAALGIAVDQAEAGRDTATAFVPRTAPDKMFEKVTISNHNLGQIKVGHASTISGIQREIHYSQLDNHIQIQQGIGIKLQQFKQHLRENEEDKWPTYIQSLDARGRMLNRQQTSFQRMMQHRDRVLHRSL